MQTGVLRRLHDVNHPLVRGLGIGTDDDDRVGIVRAHGARNRAFNGGYIARAAHRQRIDDDHTLGGDGNGDVLRRCLLLGGFCAFRQVNFQG